MSFTSRFNRYFKNWLHGNKNAMPLRKRSKSTRLFVELLEDRTLLSTLPAAVVGSTAFNLETIAPAAWGGASIRTQTTSPTVVVDPLDPTKIVEVHATFLSSDLIPGTNQPLIYGDQPGSPSVTGVASISNVPQWVLEGSYSSDEGRTWTWFSVSQAITDPALVPPDGFFPFTVIEAPSVAFDRNHHFYVVSAQHNQPGVGVSGGQTHVSGAIVMQRFDFSGATPIKDMTLGAGNGNLPNPYTNFFLPSGTFNSALSDSYSPGSAVIYRWFDQDPAMNPVVGIDDNVPSFTDPSTGQVQTDTLATMVPIPATPVTFSFSTSAFTGGVIIPGLVLPVTLAYNNVQAPVPNQSFLYDSTASTAVNFQAYLSTLPGLTAPGSVSVSGPVGGPFTVTLGNGLNPALLTIVSGAAQIDSPAYPADLVPKAIYVAYNSVQTYPQPNFTIKPLPFESKVFMVASADGGRSFTNQELVSDVQHYFNAINPVTGGVINPDQSGTEASNPQIVFSQGGAQRPSFFTYNGKKSSTFFFDITNASISQILAVLDTIPDLNGNVTVSYIGGASGSTVKNVAGATFAITFNNGTTPYLLKYDGPGTLTNTSATADTFTGITAVAGGQLMVFYNDFFNGFNRIYYDVSRPDGGNANAPVAAASIFSNSTFTLINPSPAAGTPGFTNDPIPVDFTTNGINGINNLTSITDLTVTVNAVDQTGINALSLVLIPPNGLPMVNLVMNRDNTAGQAIHPDGINSHSQGLPNTSRASLGEIPIVGGPNTYSPVGIVFDDNAPRVISEEHDGFPWTVTDAAPWIGHFQPEENNPDYVGLPVLEATAPAGNLAGFQYPFYGAGGAFGLGGFGLGALTSLIQTPNFINLAKGTWILEAIDTHNSPANDLQYIENWSLNFTGQIATTQGSPAQLGLFPDYTGAPGDGNAAIPGLVGAFGIGFPGGTHGFGVDLPLGSPFPLPISPDTPGASNVPVTTLPETLPTGPLNNYYPYPSNTPVAPAGTPGIGPVFSVAIDNTLGSFSPFEGRVYVAYTAGSGANTNIQLITSDDPIGAAPGSISPSTLATINSTGTVPFATTTDHWTIQPSLGQVNDDAPGDNFTEGNRAKFNPKITVDPVTGTLGVMWYDGRYDAQHVRVANAFTTSIDGGVTFAPDTFLNTKQTAIDFYTGATILLEPVPDNLTLAGALGFGDRSGLAMYGGRVYPVWAGNLDVAGSQIFTNIVTVAGGPRLVGGDMGPVVVDFNSGNTDYNNTFTSDGTRQLNGFVLTFDRPVDPGTLTPNLINITYRDAVTPAGSPGTDLSSQITAITPLDLSAAHGPNDFGTPASFSISDTIIQEPLTGQTLANFTVILSQPLGTSASVNWATQDGTGVGAAVSTGFNADYVPSQGTLVFAPDQTTASFQVPVLADSQFTSNRYFLVNLSNSASILIGRTQGKATIDSDSIVPAITVGNAYVLKGNPNGPAGTVNPTLNFPVFLSSPSPADVSVDFSFSDGTALNGSDYSGVPGTLTILKGNTTGTITAHAISNQFITGNLNFFLNLTNPVNASIAQAQALGVVVDNNQLAVSAGDVTVQRAAGSQQANVTFYLNGVTSQNVTITYQTVNGTALGGTDFTTVTNGTAVIAAGTQSVTAPITISGSSTPAGDKAFQVTITGVQNAAIQPSNISSTVTIVDDNLIPAIIIGDAIERQGNTGNNKPVNVPIYLTFANPSPITLNIQTAPGGPNPTAVAGTDYQAVSATTITIPTDSMILDGAGNLVPGYNFTVNLIGNQIPEFPINPTFGVQINSVVTGNATLSRNLGIVTIVSDYVQATVGDGEMMLVPAAGTRNMVFPVFLSGPSELPITVTVHTVNGSAKAGFDYTSTTQTVTFAPGEVEKTVNVPILATGFGGNFTLVATSMTVGGQPASALILPASTPGTPNGNPSGTGTIVGGRVAGTSATYRNLSPT